MTELIKPSCCNPLLLLSKRALKCIDDGAVSSSVPLPDGSPYSGEYAKYLWHMFNQGWTMELDYKGLTIPMFQYVPCGECELCKQAKRVDIVRRAELASLEYACPPYQFKLTYDDEHLPKYSELQYRDVQLFFKRLRKKLASLHLPTDFKYIVAGEYGSKNTHRPHYHVIMFNNPLRCSEFQPHLEREMKRLLWDAWQNDTWYVFSQPKNFTQCYGSMATYVTKYIGKSSPQESVFIPEAGRYKHRCFVRCSSKLGRGMMDGSLQEYRDGFDSEFEFFNPNTGSTSKHYMSKSELRYLHPAPLQILPSAVQDAYYSLCHSLVEAVRYGIMTKYDAIKLTKNVKINVQHPRMIMFDGSYDQRSSTRIISQNSDWFNPISSIIQAINDDCAILADYGHLSQSIIDHYMRFRYQKPVHDGSEVAAKLFKIRKDEAVTFDKTSD